jgi:acyl-CoA dehydrogenase
MSVTATSAEADPLLVETVEKLLGSSCTYEAVEQGETDGWCAAVWDPLADAGFPWISVPQEVGGSGGSLADAMAVVRAVGRHAAPVPVAETGVLGGWLAATAGFALGEGPLTVVPDPSALRIEEGRVRGEAVVAWAAAAARILALVAGPAGQVIISVSPQQLEILSRRNLAGEPRELVRFDIGLDDLDHAAAPEGVDDEQLRRRGCLTRIVLCAGALETLSQLTIDYAQARRQFGRPISTFQAVQQHLVTVAQCSVRASMAAELATRAVAAGGGRFEVAAARLITDAAAVDGSRSAHQAHGAMGVTREYPLHQYSRRLWAWRHEHGATALWRRQLAADVHEVGADSLFAMVTA